MDKIERDMERLVRFCLILAAIGTPIVGFIASLGG